MEAGRSSRTALMTAEVRARYQLSDPPRIFDDPLAARMVAGDSDEWVTEYLSGVPDRLMPFMIVRYRFAQDALEHAVATGVSQVVVLGAGLDTFGCRNPYEHVTVFEVDHPDTQVWKRQRMAEAGIDIPPTLRFAPVDFEQETLAAGLAAAGFDRGRPAFFTWLGVVHYLTRDALRATLGFIGGLGQRAELVLDYREPPSTAVPSEVRERFAHAERQVEAIEEPLIGFFAETEMVGELRAAGFDEIDDVALAAAITRYVGAPPSEGALAAGGHLVHATRGVSR